MHWVRWDTVCLVFYGRSGIGEVMTILVQEQVLDARYPQW